MGKFDRLITLKQIKARSNHICYNCDNEIVPDDIYYCEHIEDKFLHRLHAKKYCSVCYERYGTSLLLMSKK